ncbi:MAG: amidohydrolase family protein [Acidobacteria bacterium]|nr:amidohydrolase family protein [Acidobacteriota bacterium]
MTYDLIIRNARLRHRQANVDIGITKGVIRKIAKKITDRGRRVVRAGGRLVTESFVNPHLHLDKVYTLEMQDSTALEAYRGGTMGAAMKAIEAAARVKETYDERWILANVRRALRLAVRFGNTHIRAFADVDSKARLIGVKALLKAREEFKGTVDVQVVAFPQDGVVREPGTADLIRQAMDLGADVVGGIPWIEYTDRDAQRHIDEMFDIAKAYDADVSMLLDDAGDPGLRTLEMLAVKAIDEGWIGRCLAHHARAMSLYPEPYFRKICALLDKAGMGVITDPHTGPLHARVKELISAGVLVALGQDDIADAYYPFGRNNMLEVGFLAVHMLWMTTPAEMETIYDMITVDAARAMNISRFEIKTGSPAHLVVLDAASVYEALWSHAAPLHVISHGQLLDSEALPGAKGRSR